MSTRFLPIGAQYKINGDFDFYEYMQIERELNMLFPEVEDRRVNYISQGTGAVLVAQMIEDDSPTTLTQTYILMPMSDHYLREVRVEMIRKLTRDEFRMANHTSLRLVSVLSQIAISMREASEEILGAELIADIQEVKNSRRS